MIDRYDTGSVASPRFCFGTATDTGVFEKSPGVLAFTCDGIEVSMEEWLRYCQEKSLLTTWEVVLVKLLIAGQAVTPERKYDPMHCGYCNIPTLPNGDCPNVRCTG